MLIALTVVGVLFGYVFTVGLVHEPCFRFLRWGWDDADRDVAWIIAALWPVALPMMVAALAARGAIRLGHRGPKAIAGAMVRRSERRELERRRAEFPKARVERGGR